MLRPNMTVKYFDRKYPSYSLLSASKKTGIVGKCILCLVTIFVFIPLAHAQYNWYSIDDFSDNSLDLTKWSIAQGTPVENNQQLELSSTGINPILEVFSWDTIGLKADLTLSSSTVSTNCELGLMLSDAGNGLFLYAAIMKYGASVVLAFQVSVPSEGLIRARYIPAQLDTVYNLSVVSFDDGVQFFTNDVLVSACSDIRGFTPDAYSIGIYIGDAPNLASGIADNAMVITPTPAVKIYDRFVSKTGNHVSPFENWIDAATNIYDAIFWSQPREVVVVAPGVYEGTNTVIVYANDAVVSLDGPDTTIISANNVIRAVYMQGPNSLLDGFTVKNGYDSIGGAGIGCFGPSTVRNCIIVSNTASLNGIGGGVYIEAGTLVESCTIAHNIADGGGGVAMNAGGIIMDSKVFNNVADYAGGIESFGDGLVLRTTIASNTAGDAAGIGMFGDGTVISSLIVDNIATSITGTAGISVFSNAVIENCTICNNDSINNTTWESGVYIGQAAYVLNCIIYSNKNANGSNADYDGIVSNGLFANNCIQTVPPGAEVLTGTIVTDSPAFLSSDNYQLSSNSLCIDSGINLASITSDLDTVSCPLDGNNDGTNVQDIGCYEFASPSSDTDKDGYSDHSEAIAGTDAIDGLDSLLISGTQSSASTVISWEGAFSRYYTIYYSTNLLAGWTNDVLFTEIPSVEGIMNYTNSLGDYPLFFKITVHR